MKKVFSFLLKKILLPALTWILYNLLRIIVELLLKVAQPTQVAKFFSKIFALYTKQEKNLDKKEEQLADLFTAISKELRRLHDAEHSQDDYDFLDKALDRIKKIK
jgi:hypothetical protein